MNVLEALKRLGYDVVPEGFYSQIKVWRAWYEGNVKGFHDYRVYNGNSVINMQRYSMGMAKKVCEDWANLLMNEKVKFTLEGKKEQEFIDAVLAENNFYVKCNETQELKSAFGTGAYVPRVTNVAIDKDGNVKNDPGADIKIEYVYGENILPLSWNNGEVIECAFGTKHTTEKEEYYYVQIHKLGNNGMYDIENHLYDAKNDAMTEINLSSVDAFKNIPKVVHTGSTEKQFVIDRLNIVNNYDPSLPMGVAAFANAIDNLKSCDLIFDSYVNEFVLGKKRVMVKLEAMTNDIDGMPAFDSSDIVYYQLPEDSQTDTYIKEINMELRSQQHNAAMQDMLNALSAKVGFGENHYKYNQGSIATATQVVSENSTLFRTIKKHEIVLEKVIIELLKMLLRLGNTYMNAGLNEDVEISVDFDDSIIEDKATDFQRDIIMLERGIIQPYEFRMKWLNEDEQTAKEALPQMMQLVDDGIE